MNYKTMVAAMVLTFCAIGTMAAERTMKATETHMQGTVQGLMYMAVLKQGDVVMPLGCLTA